MMHAKYSGAAQGELTGSFTKAVGLFDAIYDSVGGESTKGNGRVHESVLTDGRIVREMFVEDVEAMIQRKPDDPPNVVRAFHIGVNEVHAKYRGGALWLQNNKRATI